MYADLHCHPGAAAYDQSHPAQEGKDKIPFDPWQIPQSNLINQSRGKSAFGYSQGDLAKSVTAGAKLLFTALYPVEKGFFAGMPGSRMGKKKIAEFYRRVQADGEITAAEWLLSDLKTQPGLEHIQKSSLEFLHCRPMNTSFERILYMQNGHYDYFDELRREYKFYRSKEGLRGATPALQLYPDGQRKNWCGTYYLADDRNGIRQKFNPLNEDITMVLTIEGIHALGVGNPEDELLRDGEPRTDVTIGKLKSRIRQLKGEEALEDPELPRWEHRPFFITFANHFNNTLCGHARSLPMEARLIIDQRKNMDKGVLKQGTYEVMQELLGLDEDLQPTGSKRILIDVKNMSAAARSDYYKYVLRPFNYKPANKSCRIPLIASHVAYSGIDRLEVQIKNTYLEKEDAHFRINKFLAWSINLSDEDVIEVHHSRGLMGLSFDRRLLGADPHPRLVSLPLKGTLRRQAMKLFAGTIAQFVRIPFAYHLDEPLRIWDTLCLGTGFDGPMDPIHRYATVLQFKTVEEDLIEILADLKKEEPVWFGSHNPEELARKICFENAFEFVVKHY